ncbi:hypothetical protein QZH41_016920, partial [Actinostola sp. cb2023]
GEDGSMELSGPPLHMDREYQTLLTPQAVTFVVNLVKHFDYQVSETDLDDGHCPTWGNQLRGLYNVHQFVHGNMPGVPNMSNAPLVILRPRAWNMLEHNMMVDGKVIPGALFDFGLHIFHNGRKMLEQGDGPFLYLPKLESHLEVRLWNDVFSWAEEHLGLPFGCIKACVLIESILASFELEQILFEIRDHCAGLNCGMWDYSASFVNTFGHRNDFILPDRKKYVSMDKQYLKSYLELVIKTCHAHGCHATGGMVPIVLPHSDPQKSQQIIQNVYRAESFQASRPYPDFQQCIALYYCNNLIMCLQIGFLIHLWYFEDVEANHPIRQPASCTETRCTSECQRPFDFTTGTSTRVVFIQVGNLRYRVTVTGGFTLDGLRNNITVGILFIQSWLKGDGSFILNGCVEDSATAEISRSQIWQAIRHQCVLENDGRKVTRALVSNQVQTLVAQLTNTKAKSPAERQQLQLAAQLLQELVLARDFPQFITTYLYENHVFIRSSTYM